MGSGMRHCIWQPSGRPACTVQFADYVISSMCSALWLAGATAIGTWCVCMAARGELEENHYLTIDHGELLWILYKSDHVQCIRRHMDDQYQWRINCQASARVLISSTDPFAASDAKSSVTIGHIPRKISSECALLLQSCLLCFLTFPNITTPPLWNVRTACACTMQRNLHNTDTTGTLPNCPYWGVP